MVSVENKVHSREPSAAIEPFATPPKLPAHFLTFSISVPAIIVNIPSVVCIKRNVMKRVLTGEIVLNVNNIYKYLEMFVWYGTSQYNFEGDWVDPPTFEHTHCSQCGELLKLNIDTVIVKADGTAICQKHQQLSLSAANKLLSSRNWKVDSFGIS